jgi:hypothetical protein
MKKLTLATLLGLFLLASSLGLFPGSSNETKPDSNLPVIQNAKPIVAPGKDGVLNKEAIMAKAASLAVPFVKNVGQFDSEVRYAADLFNGRFFLTDKELVYSLIKRSGKKSAKQDKHLQKIEPEKSMPGKGLAFKEFFVDKNGIKIDFKSSGEEQAKTKVSYFKGNDPSKWRSGVASYQGVSLGQVYPGIEVKLKASGKNVEKIFYVSPQSNVAEIKIGVAGVNGLEVAADGRLLLKNSLGELAMRAPIAWQEIAGQRHDVKVSYRLLGKKYYGFAVLGDFNKNYTLVIDPDLDTLMVSTFLGGSWNDMGNSLALDSTGNVFLAGHTTSTDFPTTDGAYNRNNGYPNRNDVFISKLDRNLTTLLASTFMGGSSRDEANSLALDSEGNVYMTGITNSADFPTTPGAHDQRFNIHGTSADAFISKLNGDLNILLASTYLGGNNHDVGNSLALDSAGNVYLTGNTWSKDFPITFSAYNGIFTDHTAFISKLNSDLTTLLASTFLGGELGAESMSIVLDRAGNVHVTGDTYSHDFPTTPGAYDRTYTPSYMGPNVFVSKLDPNLTTLLASTFLGGNYSDSANSLDLDRSDNVYVTGYTYSADFPTTTGAYDQTHNSYGDVFISKLNNNLTTLLASTFLGGNYVDVANSMVLDSSGNVYLTGKTQSIDFPTTIGAYDQTYNGDVYDGDVFVSKLNTNLTELLASTFLGGLNNIWGEEHAQEQPEVLEEFGHSLALDHLGNVYVTGTTGSRDFPTTQGAFDQSNNNYYDVFVSKLNNGFTNINVSAPNGSENWMEGSIHNINWTSPKSITSINIDYSIDCGNTFKAVVTGIANSGIFAWLIPNSLSTSCLVRISDAADASISDNSDAVFSILMNLDLQAERREVKSFSIMKQYGQIQFMITHPEVPVAEYSIMRRKGTEDFVLLKAVTPSELQNNQFKLQDKYLDKGATYTYRAEAYNSSGQLVGISAEKTI